MYPSTISSFTDPSPTDRLNSPSHSGLHSSVNSAIEQLERFVGTTSSAVGTLMYDIRAAGSNGGGHVQTAVKGGTGQTTYTKGDLLVATGPSVLSKLAVSSVVNDVLVADPSQAAGLKWSANPNSNKVAIKSSFFSYSTGQTSIANVLFSASILGSTLGLSGGSAVKFTGVIETLNANDAQTITFKAHYGVNSIASINAPIAGSAGDNVSAPLTVVGTIISSTFGTQEAYLQLLGSSSVFGLSYGTSSVNSTETLPLTITAQYSAVNNANSIAGRIFIVEKIT